MPTTPVLPVLDEDLFVPDAIEFNMANNATQPFYTFADSGTPCGTKTITHLEFGRAAHRVAHLLRPNRDGLDGEVVALILQTDTVLYHAIIAGLIVAGCVPFPMSPRNSSGAIIELLKKTSCRRVLTTPTHLKSLIDSLISHIADTPLADELQIEELPSTALVYPFLAHETADHPFESYPSVVRRPSKNDTCLYLHSSGSTGNPKPIPQNHVYWLQTSYPTDLRCRNPRLTLGVMSLPAFHTYGLAVQLFLPIYGVLSVTVFPPNSALSGSLPPIVPYPENILEHMKLTRSDAIETLPTFIQAWALMPKDVEYLKTLKFVGYAGGPLALKTGNQLSEAGVTLRPLYGGTEFGLNTSFTPPANKGPEDWEYLQFNDYMNIRWVPQGDGSFECQFLSHEKHQTMLNNLPDVAGYATSDLWRPHPTKKGLWRIVGRIDDVIVHSSGEKTVPGPMESIVVSNPLVQEAVIFGRERDQTGILIELKIGAEVDVDDPTQLASMRNKVWPAIEEANSIAPAHSKIFKEMILFASKGKPLPRTAKASVIRKLTLKIYEEEINAIYKNVEAVIGESSPVSWSIADIEVWLLEQASDLLSGCTVNPVADLFQQGFDSLHATSLRLRIGNALRSTEVSEYQEIAKNLSPNLVYSYPVIKDLAAFISSLLKSSKAIGGDDATARGTAAMEAMIVKYSLGFETPLIPVSQFSNPSLVVVLLTGSTGNLGSQVLGMLLENSRVEKVYAYNRPSQAGGKTLLQRHFERFENIGLHVALLKSEKLVFISGDAAEPNLGLDEKLYDLLRQTVNVVIHNAWRLDFNLSLASYESNIQGTRHLIDLVRSGPNPLGSRFLFISSIAAVQNWNRSKGAVPEDIMEDVSVALGGGYGEGKHIVERILYKSGLQALTLRVGQISGGRPRGAWPTTEWFPILVKSSVSLGTIPDVSGIASWLGADTISAIIVDLALNKHSMALPQVLNLVSPRPAQMSIITRSIKKAIAEILGHDLELISYGQWVSILEERTSIATSGEILATIPALKLLEFFRRCANAEAGECAPQIEAGGLPNLSTEKLEVMTEVMTSGKLQQIGDDDARLWVSYWHATGYLN